MIDGTPIRSMGLSVQKSLPLVSDAFSSVLSSGRWSRGDVMSTPSWTTLG
jgi:hypothetical protein